MTRSLQVVHDSRAIPSEYSGFRRHDCFLTVHDAAPRLLDVTDAILDAHAPGWVLALFSWKLRGLLHDSALLYPEPMSDEEFDRYVRVLEAAPDGAAMVWEKRGWFDSMSPECSERRRRSLERVRQLAEEYGRAHGNDDVP